MSKYADLGDAYWKNLNDAKFSIEGELDLGLRGIFIRDYKNYDLKIGTMGVAVSTVLNSRLFDKFGEAALTEAIEDYIKEKDLGIFAIIAIEVDETGGLHKGIFLYRSATSNQKLHETFPELV